MTREEKIAKLRGEWIKAFGDPNTPEVKARIVETVAFLESRTYDRQYLIDLVRKNAIRYGDFTLASGAKSKFYIDCRRVTLHSKGAVLIADGMLSAIGDANAVGGLTIGADPIVGAMLARAADRGLPDLRGFLVRKEAKDHGTGKLVEGPLFSGDKVVIVEDVTTTGDSCLKAIKAVEDMGCIVVLVLSVIDRLAGAADKLKDAGYPYASLLNLHDLGLEV